MYSITGIHFINIKQNAMDNVTNNIENNDDNVNELSEQSLSGPRYVAVKLLSRYERSDSYIDKLLDYEHKNADLNSMDKALLHEIVNGVIRWKGKLDWVLTGFYRGDYQKCLNIIKNAMRVGLYQIMFLNKIPVHAAIDESVEIVKRIQGDKTAGIVNAVLRNIVRNYDKIRYPVIEDDIVYYLSTYYSHPKWMVKRWLERFGEQDTTELLLSNNNRPYLPLRINTLKTNSDSVFAYLDDRKVKYNKFELLKSSFSLRTLKGNVINSDLFKNGEITVQDPSATFAARLAAPKEGDFIIDLCAAPGGKSFCLAEQINDNGTIHAVEKYSSKLRFIEEGAARLGLTSIHTETEDATTYKSDKKADLVFADVPCSGLGTLTKKPDIKWKRDIDDIPKIVTLQKAIMKNAAELVADGGVLVYSTCTIEPEENTDMIEWFLKEFPDFILDPAENYLPEEICKDGYMQTYPHTHGFDGAFAARLVKKGK